MTDWSTGMWWALMAIGVTGSAIYSGLETGIYSINRIRLQIGHHKNLPAACILNRLIQKPATLLGTLLIGNNIANYLGTASLAVILERRGLSDLGVIIVNVLLITPALLIFGEVLPKDLFSAHSDQLTYPFARFLDWSRRLFRCCGLLPLTAAVNEVASHMLGVRHLGAPFHPRRQVERLVKEGVGYGLLSDEQSAIVQRVLDLGSLTVADEMVPWHKVTRVTIDDQPTIMWDLADRTSHARFPVLDTQGKVVGVINVYDALINQAASCPSLQELVTPVLQLDAATPLRTALTTLQTQHAAFAVVTRGEEPIGVVTVKDLVEPITGELDSW